MKNLSFGSVERQPEYHLPLDMGFSTVPGNHIRRTLNPSSKRAAAIIINWRKVVPWTSRKRNSGSLSATIAGYLLFRWISVFESRISLKKQCPRSEGRRQCYTSLKKPKGVCTTDCTMGLSLLPKQASSERMGNDIWLPLLLASKTRKAIMFQKHPSDFGRSENRKEWKSGLKFFFLHWA